jgi:four helix bundle protein
MYIACKESRETLFWLQLLRDTHKVPTQQIEPHINACDELLRILITTTKRLKQKSGE